MLLAMALEKTLYTIGYEGSRVEDFVLTLQDAGIHTLLDVREMPLSRKKGFSKSILKATLEANGIRYVHLRGLGDPKAGREAARAGDYRLFRRIFGQHMTTPYAQTDLHVAAEMARKAPVCLMCFEHNHCECHRSIVANHLLELTGMQVHNLTVDTGISLHGQPFIIPNHLAA
ncbi:MAG: DUF488 domain-containing protein [Alphaproteobacteria bacterium]